MNCLKSISNFFIHLSLINSLENVSLNRSSVKHHEQILPKYERHGRCKTAKSSSITFNFWNVFWVFFEFIGF